MSQKQSNHINAPTENALSVITPPYVSINHPHIKLPLDTPENNYQCINIDYL